MSDLLEMFTIYRHPADFPCKFVVRRWTIKPGQPTPDPAPLAVVDTLEQARDALPQKGLYRLGRYEADDPCIVETWI